MPHPIIPGIQKGWTVREFAKSPTNDRDATVLCERTPNSPFDCNFVSWNANMVEGGCFHGKYFYKYEDALRAFNERRVQLK